MHTTNDLASQATPATAVPTVKASLEPQAFYLAVYTSLRDEIIQRITLANNIQSLTLVLAGAFLSAGLQTNIRESVYLVYPLPAFFLALGWLHNDRKRFQIAEYLRTIEREAGLPAWGLRHLEFRSSTGATSLLERASSLGLFLGLSTLMTVLGYGAATSFGLIEQALFVMDVLTVVGIGGLWIGAKSW